MLIDYSTGGTRQALTLTLAVYPAIFIADTRQARESSGVVAVFLNSMWRRQ